MMGPGGTLERTGIRFGVSEGNCRDRSPVRLYGVNCKNATRLPIADRFRERVTNGYLQHRDLACLA